MLTLEIHMSWSYKIGPLILKLLLFCKHLSVIVGFRRFLEFVCCCFWFLRCRIISFRRLDPGLSNMIVWGCCFSEQIYSINYITNNLYQLIFKFLSNASPPISLNIHASQLYIQNLCMICSQFTFIFPSNINNFLVLKHQPIFTFLYLDC